MDYPEFREEIFYILKKIVPKDVQITLRCVTKLNGCRRYGISFGAADSNFAPTIYLEPFYHSFLQGRDIEVLAKELLGCYEEEAGQMPEGIQCLECFDNVRTDIYLKLIHTEENSVLLEDTPHIPFMDFSVVPYLEVRTDTGFKGSVQIKEEHLSLWQITKEEVMSCAMCNTREKKGICCISMNEMLHLCMQGTEERDLEDIGKGMLVLTNRERYLGAVVVWFSDVTDQIGKTLQESYYMLPSSIHEWIIVPKSSAPDEERLLDIVRDINDTEVSAEEILSYNLYFFDAASQKINICQNKKYKNY